MRRLIRTTAEAGALACICVGFGCLAIAYVCGRVAFATDAPDERGY